MTMAKILIVEDDPALQKNVKGWLEAEHFMVETVGTAQDALSFVGAYKYDLLILDWELPDSTGFDICKSYRQGGGKAPVLFLTARSSIDDKEAGLEVGGDDYLTKPFHVRELLARVRALLRRPSSLNDNVLHAGNLILDSKSFRLTKGGRDVRLARMEFALLEFLMRNQGQVFSQEALLERVWSSDSERSSEGLRGCIKKLRDKIDDKDQASLITNIHGVGYKFDPPAVD
jgi:DNA-binding response OmpR family regulator